MKGSIYHDFENVDVYDESADAFSYDGPHRVICHPPCARWGKYATRYGHQVGDDGGAFEFCLRQVNYWGGIIEHPAFSKAWDYFALPKPSPGGGWAGDGRGFSCHIEQGNYGHPAPKATWLFMSNVRPIPLTWGPSNATGRITEMNRSMREHTPRLFAQLLMGMVMQ